jgi:hypothetical protein
MVGRELDAIDLCVLPAAEAWYEALEALALAALDDRFDLAAFDAPRPLALPSTETTRGEITLAAPGRRLPLPEPAVVEAECRAAAPRAIFWTLGSGGIAASLLLAPALPGAAAFAALLDGDWTAHGWEAGGSTASSRPDGEAALAWDRD